MFNISVVKLKDHNNCIDISRPKALGNPFVMQHEGQRETVCDDYQNWLDSKIQNKDKRILRELYRLAYIYRENSQLKLGCYCAPKRCHGDSVKIAIEAILKELNDETVLEFAQDIIKGYEVSSIGDRRFSPLYARLSDGRTIEEHYQCDVKGFNPGGTNWRAYKGKTPLRIISPEQTFQEYTSLWEKYFDISSEHIDLEEFAIYILNVYNGKLHDTFAKTNINQANAIACILNQRFGGLFQ